MIHYLIPPLMFASSLFLSAAETGGRRVVLPGVWMSAELPSTWAPTSDGFGFEPKVQPDPEKVMGISVDWNEGAQADMLADLEREAKPTPAQLKTRGAKSFSAGLVLKQGSWRWVQTRQGKGSGPDLNVLYAVRPAPGGFYSLAYFAREPHFSKYRSVAQMALDSFRREPSPLSYSRYADPGDRFQLDAPSAPWTASNDATEGVLRFIGPPGPGRGAPPILSLYRLPAPKSAAQAGAVLRSHVSGLSARFGELALASGKILTAEYDTVMEGREIPEAAGRGPFRSRTRQAVVEHAGSFYMVSLLANPSSAADWAPVFRKALETLRFK